MSGPARRHLTTALQVAASLALLALVVALVDFRQLWQRLAAADPLWIAAGLAVGAAQLVALGHRWHVLNRALHLAPRLDGGDYLALIALTHAASQVLPSSVGGDAVRIVAMRRRRGVPMASCLLSVACDRMAGLTGIVVLALGGLAASGIPAGAGPAAQVSLIAAALLAGLILAAPRLAHWPLLMRLARRFGLAATLDAGARLLRDPLTSGRILLLSVLPHALNIVIAFCAARALGLAIPVLVLAAALPIAILVMTLPISFAGWGVREAVAVFALGLAGVPGGEALAVSVLWGVLLSALGLLVLAPALHWMNRGGNTAAPPA